MTQTRMKATSGAQPQMCSGTAGLSLQASTATALHNWAQLTAQVVPLCQAGLGPLLLYPASPSACTTTCLLPFWPQPLLLE